MEGGIHSLQLASFGIGRLLPHAMDKAFLQVGEYRGADFDQLIAAVVRHNLSIGKEHKIKGRKPQRLYISCSRGDERDFRVNSLLVSGVGLRIIKFQQHDCQGGSVQKLQVRTAVIKSISDTVDKSSSAKAAVPVTPRRCSRR